MNDLRNENRTIAAIATAPGKAALGLIRVSGPAAFSIVCPLLEGGNGESPAPVPNRAVYCRIRKAEQVYDEAVATFYAAPRSYTGENTVELCCHGGPFVLQSVLRLLLEEGCALAKPGEFSKRAFLHGKLDFIKAQAVVDLIDAVSEAERKNALALLEGNLSRALGDLYDRLVSLNAELNAYVDFPDEVEEPETNYAAALREILEQIEALLSGSRGGMLIREGVRVAIVGAPNAGKSTLLNRLLGEDRAIVSAIPGTTRDRITENASLGGLKCVLTDTAGIREAEEEIERLGVEISRREIARAAAVFAVFDGSRPLSVDDRAVIGLTRKTKALAIVNKADLPQKIDAEYIEKEFQQIVYVSAQTGAGCEEIGEWIRAQFAPADEAAGVLTAPEQIDRLLEARRCLTQALAGLEKGFTPDLAALDITEAAAAVGAVTGRTVTDQMIDQIFSRFCVGK